MKWYEYNSCLHTITYPSGCLGCLKVPVAVVSDPGLSTMKILDGKFVLRPELSKFLL